MGSYPKSINASSLNDWFNSEKEDPVLIDVREQSELELARFSKEFLHIPISKVTSEYVEKNICWIVVNFVWSSNLFNITKI